MANKKSVKYTEPTGYFPESIRKKYAIGEHAEKKADAKKTPVKKADTKKK